VGTAQVQYTQRLTYLTSPFLLLYLLLYLQRDGPNRVDIWTDLKWGSRILAEVQVQIVLCAIITARVHVGQLSFGRDMMPRSILNTDKRLAVRAHWLASISLPCRYLYPRLLHRYFAGRWDGIARRRFRRYRPCCLSSPMAIANGPGIWPGSRS
jgi:hypothetical protein